MSVKMALARTEEFIAAVASAKVWNRYFLLQYVTIDIVDLFDEFSIEHRRLLD